LLALRAGKEFASPQRQQGVLLWEIALAEPARKSSNPFDVRTIEQLVALMSQHELSEIDLQAGDLRIRLRRGASKIKVASKPLVELPPAISTPVPKPTEKAPAPARQLIDIKSPTIGTFYAQEKPGAPPYVAPGTRVTSSTVVCKIEAMKIFNEIQAECAGVIVEVLVKNEAFVEFGTVLFRVDPNA
jgi:acetyl-CoA carboxylase biotin carboxyl carrier protein